MVLNTAANKSIFRSRAGQSTNTLPLQILVHCGKQSAANHTTCENQVKGCTDNLKKIDSKKRRIMDKNLLKKVWFFMLLTLPGILYAQKDVTQFLGIPVDGSKSEMIQKLKDKGYTISPNKEDVLVGEFNGTDVNIYIVTNNNKVRRIAIVDANPTSEANIKTRFNKLLQQFQNNKRYLFTSDSTIQKYKIPESERISYELTVHNKQYQMVFYQQTAGYDSLTLKINTLNEKQKQTPNDAYINQLTELIRNQMEEVYKCFNKKVWVNISILSGEFYITIFYDNVYNEGNGESL